MNLAPMWSPSVPGSGCFTNHANLPLMPPKQPRSTHCTPQGLSQFGNGFLSKFESAQCDNRLLEEISLVDTPGADLGPGHALRQAQYMSREESCCGPACELVGKNLLSEGAQPCLRCMLRMALHLVHTPPHHTSLHAGVLSGEKQRIERTYDFIQVCGWFAARCDLILLLFDPYKLDISDEFKEVCGEEGPWGLPMSWRLGNQWEWASQDTQLANSQSHSGMYHGASTLCKVVG